MSQGTGTIDKIKLIDGTIVDLLQNQYINIPDLSEVYIYMQITDFTGSVNLISGTTDQYILTMNPT